MKFTVNLIVHGDFTHIEPALRSLYASTKVPFCAYVIINTGAHPRVDELRAAFPEVAFLINETPQGFATNHNRVMRLAETEFVALLNDDLLLHEGALDTLVAYLEAHPEAALVGPELRNPDGTRQVSVYGDPGLLRMVYKITGLALLTRQQSLLRRWLQSLGIARLVKTESLQVYHEARPVPVIKGAVMVVRRTAYQQVGLMDETTLAYGEEPDWHLRFRQAGWQVVFVPQASVTHYGSGQAQLKLHGPMLVEDRKAILNYYLKHRPSWEALVIRGTLVASHGLWGTLWLPFSRERARTHYQVARLGASWQRARST